MQQSLNHVILIWSLNIVQALTSKVCLTNCLNKFCLSAVWLQSKQMTQILHLTHSRYLKFPQHHGFSSVLPLNNVSGCPKFTCFLISSMIQSKKSLQHCRTQWVKPHSRHWCFGWLTGGISLKNCCDSGFHTLIGDSLNIEYPVMMAESRIRPFFTHFV